MRIDSGEVMQKTVQPPANEAVRPGIVPTMFPIVSVFSFDPPSETRPKSRTPPVRPENVRPVLFGIGTGVPFRVSVLVGARSASAVIEPSGLPTIDIRLVPTVTPLGNVRPSVPRSEATVAVLTAPVGPLVVTFSVPTTASDTIWAMFW